MKNENEKRAAKPRLMFSQIDMGESMDMPKNVNLFRGEVCFPMELISMSDNKNENMLSVTAYYGNNIQQASQNWNSEPDTSIMGAGWRLPLEKITSTPSYSALNDDETYYLQSGETTLELLLYKITNEYIEYQTNIYNLWRIRYYKDPSGGIKSYWEIIKEDGSAYIYGAYIKDGAMNFDNKGAQEFRLRENNWSGSSVRLNRTYTVSWHLTQIIPNFENEISFYYDNTLILNKGNTSSYTRSVRLSRITDLKGVTVDFNYRNKEEFEIIPPHQSNAFQFYYQEKYLDNISVKQNNEHIFSINFQYSFYEPEKGVDYKKRFLVSITKKLDNGDDMPSHTFEYEMLEFKGALRRVQFPSGATCSYTYERKELELAALDFEIKNPVNGAKPCFYHGADYEVILWKSIEKKSLNLYACSWNGTWIPWSSQAINNVKTDEVNVLTRGDFFAMYYKEASTQKYSIHVFRRDKEQYGLWKEFTVNLDPGVKDLTVAAGTDFVAYQSPQNRNINFITFDHLKNDWVKTTVNINSYDKSYMMATHNNCVLASYNISRKELIYTIYYNTGYAVWNKGGEKCVPNVVIDLENTNEESFFSGNNSFGTATFIKNIDDKDVYYTVHSFIMDYNHNFKDFMYEDKKQPKTVNNPVGYSVATDEMFFNGQNAYRYNGVNFIKQNALNPREGYEYVYNGFNDLFVAAEKKGGTIENILFKYDPCKEIWGKMTSVKVGSEIMIIPQISDEYCVIGKNVYNKASDEEWVLTEGRLPSDTNANTVVLGESYIIYQRKGYGNSVFLQHLKDGDFSGKPIEFKDELIPLDENKNHIGPAGPYFFITYKGNDLNNINSVKLHYAASGSENNKLYAHVVSSCTVDNGINKIKTSYEYKTKTGAYDKYLLTPMFSVAKTIVGEGNGWEQKIFYNNNSETCPDCLNGYSKEVIYSNSDGNKVYYEKTPHAADGKLGDDLLPGVRVFQTGKMCGTLAGDVFIESNEYIEYNRLGQPYKNIEYGYGSDGKMFMLTTVREYAWQYVDEMKKLNILDSMAMINTYNGDTLIESTAVKYKKFNGKWWAQNEKWQCTDPEKPFDFNADPAKGWIKTETIVERNNKGHAVKNKDIDGIINFQGYDNNERQNIFTTRNVMENKNDCYYTGFEKYEKNDYETVIPGVSQVEIIEYEANTGNSSLKITGNGIKCGIKKTIAVSEKSYILSFFAKTTQTGHSSEIGGAVWINGSYYGETGIPATGKWEYINLIIQKEKSEKIEIYIYNKFKEPLYIDNLFISPLEGGSEAIIYDKKETLIIASVNCLGRICRTAYDHFGHKVLTSNDNTLTSINVSFNPREANCQNSVELSAQYEFKVLDRGYFNDFTSVFGWEEFIDVTPKSGFEVTQGALWGKGILEIGNINGTQNYVAYFELKTQNQAQIKIGDFQIDLPVNKSYTKQNYLLFINNDKLLLLHNGKPVGLAQPSCIIKGSVQINFKEKNALEHIGIGYGCTASAEYKNNTGDCIQVQVINGSNMDVSARLYDEYGNKEAVSGCASYEGGIFGYKPGFFTGIDGMGKAVGEINNKIKEAQGYPFSRILYEKSPLSREIEKSMPGKEYAFIPGVNKENRRTKKISYINNSILKKYSNYNLFKELPEGKYSILEITDIDGGIIHNILDSKGNIIAKCKISDDGVECTYTLFNKAFQPEKVFLPNYFKGSGQSENFVIKSRYDFSGRLIWQKTIDSDAASSYSYDAAGRLKDLSDAKGQSEGYVINRKYDKFGRMISEGYLKNNGEEVILKQYLYNSTDIKSCGKIVKQISQNDLTKEKITEEFFYDSRGYIEKKVLKTPFEKEFATIYSYDIAGNVTQICCEENGKILFQTAYEYNNLNRFDNIKYTQNGKTFDAVEYSYAPGGLLAKESYGKEGIRQYKYNTAGMLIEVTDPFFEQKISYQNNGSASARIQACSYKFPAVSGDGNFADVYTAKNKYDGFGQLISVTNDLGSGYNTAYSYDSNSNIVSMEEGTGKLQYQYKQNSNRLDDVKTSDGKVMGYSYDSLGNVKQSEISKITNINYDKLSQISLDIEYRSGSGTEKIKLFYTANDLRTVKDTKDYTKIYIRDLSGNILMEYVIHKKAENNGEHTFYIQGYNGITGFVKGKDNTFYRLIKDYLGSTRAIVRSGQTILAYNYQPFGDIMGSVYRKDNIEDITAYLFTRHEYEHEIYIYNFNARLYEQKTGRFLGIDSKTEFPNPYAYCANNPMMIIDEDGEGFLTAFLLTALISFTVGTITSTIVYACTTDKFDWGQFGINVGISAAVSLVSGLFSGIGSLVSAGVSTAATAATAAAAQSTSAAWEITKGVAVGLVIGGMSATCGQIVANAINGDNISNMLWQSAVMGMFFGALSGGIGAKLDFDKSVLELTGSKEVIDKFAKKAFAINTVCESVFSVFETGNDSVIEYFTTTGEQTAEPQKDAAALSNRLNNFYINAASPSFT